MKNITINNNAQNLTEIIKKGGVVLMQVDTIYGLICDGLNNEAVSKIEQIKQRTKPAFGFFVKNIQIAKKYAIMSNLQQQCFESVFPGYFTLIFKATELAKQSLPIRALGRQNDYFTIGIRVPKSQFCLKILKHFDTPLVATSANISGQKTASCFEDIDANIIKSVDAIYYDTTTPIAGASSTIIDTTNQNIFKIIRQGSGDVNVLKDLVKFE